MEVNKDEIKEKKERELDEEFFEDLAMEGVDSEETLKEEIKKSIESHKKADAENKYIDFVTKLVPQWKQADHCETLETTDSGESNMTGGFGMKVSTMTIPYIF